MIPCQRPRRSRKRIYDVAPGWPKPESKEERQNTLELLAARDRCDRGCGQRGLPFSSTMLIA
ncbi:hypothetical protein LMG28727_03121 [Paraburkholderia kirstenboschensis]|nr:hypothetical protein LMG28727_03121 [Paraburkholderia kirstenboschensis]